jgi:DNA modification methylase
MSYQPQYLNQVIQGDCTEVLKDLPDACIDLVLTDPPYLVNYVSRDGCRIVGDDTDRWLGPTFNQAYRVLKPDSFCISFYGWTKADRFLAAWRRAGFRPVEHFVAIKSYSSSQGLARRQHEQAYLLAKGNGKSQVAISDVFKWEYTGNRLHPTQKPLSVLLPLIKAYSKPDDVVLDPFCGSGSTLVAARLLGRRYIGVEQEYAHCKTARQRLLDR